MDLRIKDKVYLVTGGGSGIGGGISVALAREGAIPVILGRSPLQKSFRAEVRALQPLMHFIQIELTDEQACADAVQEAVSMYGRIDGLINCAGGIDNVSLETALTGQGGTSGYTAAKGGILSLTREWAASYLKDGIRVNAVVPAEVWTPLYERWVNTFPRPAEKLETIVRNIPLGHRMTTVEELADMAVFLLSPLSSHTTGQWVVVDGGYTHLDRTLTAR